MNAEALRSSVCLSLLRYHSLLLNWKTNPKSCVEFSPLGYSAPKGFYWGWPPSYWQTGSSILHKFDCFRKVSQGLEFGSFIHLYNWNIVSLSVVDTIQNHFLWEKSALAAEYIFLETSSHLLELVLPIFKVWAEFYPLASSSPNLPYTEK